jgi:hypothetical protein
LNYRQNCEVLAYDSVATWRQATSRAARTDAILADGQRTMDCSSLPTWGGYPM